MQMPAEKIEVIPREANHDKFVRLIEPRMAVAIKAINQVAKLANRHHYSYSEDEVGQVIGALEETVAKAKNCFTREQPTVAVFTLNPQK